jgi:hypothetical protein
MHPAGLLSFFVLHPLGKSTCIYCLPYRRESNDVVVESRSLETTESNYFSRVQTRGFVYTLRMNILT